MAKVTRRHLPSSDLAAKALGSMITEGRRERGWTAAELAERLGITPPTMRRIERGESSVSVGLIFDAAILTVVPLFATTPNELPHIARDAAARAALLTNRRRPRTRTISGDL